MPKKRTAGKRLRITYTKSSIGYAKDQKGTVVALGLKRVGEVVEFADGPVVRGMVAKVSHLVKVEEIEG
ncbi:MAG: 50S ribosomal protein L30 [Chloroflexi bacterium ADurb.Bin180]|nr:MAG: 50S ribosomal protein L30 [Chloroflexi bacterium ADurb.Bin180]HOU23893.1 50S ribosomal protein L30 [Anaerolineae bacterium]HQJ50680.1 50S ribosomal protein L30 [Anaerolineae bacterium]